MEEKMLTISQAVEYLGISLNTLRRWDESGKLIAIRKDGGTHRYYWEKDIEIFASGDAEVRMQDDKKNFQVTRGVNIVNGCLAKIEF